MEQKALWVALVTLLKKEIIRFLRVWVQTLVPPAITMALYFLIFGRMIGSQLPDIHGFSYIQYIAPGLIMMGIITNSYTNSVSSFYLSKFQKSIEEMLVSPMPNWVILFGFIGGGLIRGLLVGIIVTMIALFFTHMPIHHPFVLLSMASLTSILFSLAGVINAVFAKSFDDISIIPTFVLTPLTYLGGVFYSIDRLPDYFRVVAHLNPIVYMVNGLRMGFLGVSDVDLTLSYGLLIAVIIILYVWAMYLINTGKGIRH
jgi:ABC-2 type transport system permease protein